LPNSDPLSSQHFVDETTGLVTAGQPFLGEQIDLVSDCKNGVGQNGCNLKRNPQAGPGQRIDYVPMVASASHTYCPSDAAPGCGNGNKTDFEQSTECCDGTSFDFQQCGASTNVASWDPSTNPGVPNGPAESGLQCLIHTTTTGPSGQQDSIDVTNFQAGSGPPQISPGIFSQNRYNIGAGAAMDTSDSIITVPLIHVPPSGPMPANHQVTIVGFLQLFVKDVNPPGSGPSDVDAIVVNVIGCGKNTAAGTAVSGGGVSPIPVRLVHK
jgi:hypothetical protein